MIPKSEQPEAGMAEEEKQNGGGSGGGPDLDHHQEFMGTFGVAANQVSLVSRPPFPPAPAAPYVIKIFSPGAGEDGFVDVRGSKGVRITTGPPPIPPMHSDSTNGMEVEVSEAQNITLKRGLIPMVDQKIDMAPGQITVDGGEGVVKIQSVTSIEISCAMGACSIKLTPAAIILQGPIIMIN